MCTAISCRLDACTIVLIQFVLTQGNRLCKQCRSFRVCVCVCVCVCVFGGRRGGGGGGSCVGNVDFVCVFV